MFIATQIIDDYVNHLSENQPNYPQCEMTWQLNIQQTRLVL